MRTFREYSDIQQICYLISEDVDTDKIANFISARIPEPTGEQLGSLFADISKRLVPERVTSRFLGDLFNSIARRIGKKIVLPEKGGQEFHFGSTRDQHKINWHDIESGKKIDQLFNLAKYYLKYPEGKDVRTNLLNAIDYDKSNPNVKRGVSGVINRVLKRIEMHNQQSQQSQQSQQQPYRNAAMSVDKGYASRPVAKENPDDIFSISPKKEDNPDIWGR